MLLAGCVTGGPSGSPSPSPSALSATVDLFSNITLSGGQTFTVVYNASSNATSISAFYVEVESTAADAPTVGPEITFATGLPSGSARTVPLNTASIELGLYRIGLNVSGAGETLKVLSPGTFRITELPEPVFELPDANLAITPGTPVDVRVDLGDPENAVQWRLFYAENPPSTAGVPIDEIGDTIATGSTNVVIETWNTSGVPLGTYRLGISVTDSGQSISQTVDAGQEDRINTVFNGFRVQLTTTPPPPVPPSLVVSQPASDTTILGSETVLIQFSAMILDEQSPPAQRQLTVFYDFDGMVDTGDEMVISDDLPVTATNAVFSGDLIEEGETVHVGVTVDDGRNDPVTQYAPGTITKVGLEAVTLAVTQPNSPLPKKPGTTVNVAWQTTNLPSSVGATVEVFMRRVDANGDPTGDEMEILPPSPTSVMSTSFEADAPGRFQVFVRINFPEDEREALVESAPALVVVSTRAPIFWLGELTRANSSLEGAIFEGVNFEDNAGSSFEGGQDFDGDGVDECFIVSRYAKPDFVNPSGIGAGEGYMVRGREGFRYTGVYNLNSVSSSLVPGLVFTGIEPNPTPADPAADIDETDGMARIFLTRGGLSASDQPLDADGDGVGEIAFGFPRTRSQWNAATPLSGPRPIPDVMGTPLDTCGGRNPLARDANGWVIPQFFRGGVVIVSSVNRVLRLKSDDTQGRRVPLDFVGQRFEAVAGAFTRPYEPVSPEPDQGPLCSNSSSWMADDLAWTEDGECPEPGTSEPATGEVGCIAGSDNIQETLEEPDHTFDLRLADPWACYFLPFLSSNPACAEAVAAGCPASDDLCDPGAGVTCDSDQIDITLPLCDMSRPFEQELSGLPACDPPPNTGACEDQALAAMQSMPLFQFLIAANGTGYYRERISGTPEFDDAGGSDESGVNWNDIIEEEGFSGSKPRTGMVGCRIIGRENYDGAGTSITQSDNDLIITAPFNSDFNTNGGAAYFALFDPVFGVSTFRLPRYWQLPNNSVFDFSPLDYSNRAAPVQPHQYLAGGDSFTGIRPGSVSIRGHWDTDGVRIIGDEEELIQEVVAIPDFNIDGRNDIAIGAPRADVDGDGTLDGAVYIIFRRQPSLEGNFRLANLKLPINDTERLAGVLIREEFGDGQRFGESIAGDFDFDHDGNRDIVIGNPDGNGGTGEVIIVFGANDTISQGDGIPIEDEPGELGILTRRQAARITGSQIGSEFGFNVANVGDLDGDGENDLAIAAPNATPMFDGNLNDAADVLDTPGLDGVVDADGNGVIDEPDGEADDVTGPLGRPDGLVNINDELRRAGLVYIVLSSTRVQDFAATSLAPMDVSIDRLGSDVLDGYIIVGRRGERYNTTVNPPVLLHAGDFLGGGDAGQSVPVTIHGVTIYYGGNPAKAAEQLLDQAGNTRLGADGNPLLRQRGRSYGLGRAGDIDGDGRGELLLGSQLADPRVDPITGEGTSNGGEAYLIYGFEQ